MSDQPVLSRVDKLEAAIKLHRDQRGDDRCWLDDLTLYATLEDTNPRMEFMLPRKGEFLANCERYWECRQTGTRYSAIGELGQYLARQEQWSGRTFGQSTRTLGLIKHIRKELDEIIQNPHDLEEWIDVVILALEGYWRHGGNPSSIMGALEAKQQKNFARQWPTIQPDDQATEHVR